MFDVLISQKILIDSPPPPLWNYISLPHNHVTTVSYVNTDWKKNKFNITVDIWLKLQEGQFLLNSQLYVTIQHYFDVVQFTFHPVDEDGHVVVKEYAEYRHAVMSIYPYGARAKGCDLYTLQHPAMNKTLTRNNIPKTSV